MAKETRLYLRCSRNEKERIANAAKVDAAGDVSKMVLDAVMRRVKRIERKHGRSDTAHLLSTAENERQLKASIAELNKGESND